MRSSLIKSLFVALALGALTVDSVVAQPVQVISYDSTWKYHDAGMDLGTAWREPAFNDTAWASGPGALGFPANENLLGLATVQTPINDVIAGTRIRTHYFRIKFQWNQSPQGVSLLSTNLVDDGAVFYLNGVEVGRLAMPTTAIAYTSFATRQNDILMRGAEALTFAATSLIQGENVLAVEVHQGGGGSNDDAIMAMTLWGVQPAAGPAMITTHPERQATSIGVPVTFNVGVAGTPPLTFQWRKDGVDIPGANGQSYTISNPNLADPGEYSVFVSNALGSDTSNPAFLSVIAVPIHLIRWNHTWRIEDSATDLGTAWRANNYNDASWRSGPGPLGFETAAIAVPVATATADMDHLTTYFRSTFQFNNEPLDVSLTFTNLSDDGMVVYINEQEVLRLGMAEGQVTFGTAAGRTVGDAGLETAIIPAEVLVPGLNRIAVEAHQVNTTSSDLVMGLTLTANFLAPTAITITNQPKNLVVEELKRAVFEAEISGNSPRYQWFKDGVAIPGANARRYVIPNVAFADAGQYRLVVSNPVSEVTSSPATLTVVPDTNAPVLLRADGTLNFTTIVVSFDEALQAASATTPANYVVSNVTMGAAGATLAISSAVLTNATNVVLTTAARMPEQNYLLFARNVRDAHPNQNIVRPNSVVPVISLLRMILPTESWFFYDPIPPFDPPITGTAWRQSTFDPAAASWGQGPGGFVYDLNNQDLPIERGTFLSQGATTKYFWKTFEYRGSPSGADLRLRHVIDDGAIFYLNGQELIRYNMPAGPVDGDTPSAAAIGVANFENTSVPAELLHFGENVIAVEVHGRAPNDLDWVFSLELQGLIESYATGAVLIVRHPLSQTAIEGHPVSFDFSGVGGSRFQWRRNGVNIPGATNAVYLIPAAPLDWNGSTFSVVVNNTTGNATSSNATLTVLHDTGGPVLLSAFGNGNQVAVNFNEPLNMSSAVTLANYRITNSTGMRGISAARLTNGNQVVLTTATPAQVDDVLIVNGVTDNSLGQNAIQPNSAVTIGFESLLLPIDAVWRFNADNQNLGSAWREYGYNDSAWMSGPALLGEEGSSLPVILRTPVPAPGSGGPLTSYFRTHFNFPGPPAGRSLTMSFIIDDGAVFFLNGQEFYRIGVPAGEGFGTLANRTIGDAGWEGPELLQVPSLRAGDNVLAVANHQASDGSSDIVVGVELSMDPVPSMVLTMTEDNSFLRITHLANGMVQVDWGGDGFILEQTSSLSTPINWMAVSNQPKPYVFTPAVSGTQFFRLRQ